MILVHTDHRTDPPVKRPAPCPCAAEHTGSRGRSQGVCSAVATDTPGARVWQRDARASAAFDSDQAVWQSDGCGDGERQAGREACSVLTSWETYVPLNRKENKTVALSLHTSATHFSMTNISVAVLGLLIPNMELIVQA